MVLVLGIVGLVLPIFVPGLLAWIFGHQDLGKMREGVMDPDGKGMTTAGYICGMIATLISAAALALMLLGFAVPCCCLGGAGLRRW